MDKAKNCVLPVERLVRVETDVKWIKKIQYLILSAVIALCVKVIVFL